MSEGKDDRGLFQTVGEELAATRIAQGLDVAEISRRTRIPARHIETIERGDYAELPALPYSAGFVKTYANLLGLDGQAMSRAFRDQMGDVERGAFEPEAYEPADPSRVPSRLLAMIALGVALLLGIAYLLLRFEGDNSDLAKLAADTPEEITPAQRPKPVAAPVPVPAQPAVPAGPITISATEDVWMQVSQADGPKLFMNVLKAGDSFTVPDTAVDPTLRTGRPQSIKIKIGETALPPIGEPDHLVRAYSLKRDALLAIVAPKAPAAAPTGIADGNSVAPVASAPNAAPVAGTGETAQPRHIRHHRLRRENGGDQPGADAIEAPQSRP